MRRHIRQRGVLEDMLPMVREATERVVLTQPREDVCADIVGAPSLEIFDDRQPDGTDGFTLLAVFQPQVARLGVGLRPFQADHLASPGAGQRNLTDNVYDRGVFLLLDGLAEHPTQNSILRLRQPPLSHVVFWLADAVCRVALDDPCLDGVGKNAAEKTNSTRGRSSPASDDGLSAELLGLDRNPRLSGHDVLEDLVDVGLGEVLDPSRSQKWDAMALNTAGVGGDSRRFFWPPSFAQDEP